MMGIGWLMIRVGIDMDARLRDMFVIRDIKEGTIEFRVEFTNDQFHSFTIPVIKTNPADLSRRLEEMAYFIMNDPALRPE